MVHLRPRITDDLDIFGEEVVTIKTKEGGEGLLLREITGCAEDDDDGVVLELDVAGGNGEWLAADLAMARTV